MAGHSKWANIKHRKAREDAKKGKSFTKLVKDITSSARRGGGDLSMNPELRLAVQKAKEGNMPSENIERAILKATGQLEGVTYESFSYEGYAPGGVAIMITGATDNRNRTVAEVRHIFNKHGGNLGQDGCVAWMFSSKGIMSIEASGEQVDKLMELALEHGADDLEDEDGIVTITTEPHDYPRVREGLIAGGFTEFLTDEVQIVAETNVTPDSVADAKKAWRIIEFLEEYDDVETLAHNLEMTEELAEALEQ